MVPRLRPHWLSEKRCLSVWRSAALNAAEFLRRQPGFETVARTFASLSRDGSIADIVRELFRSLFLSNSAFVAANSVLERLPMAAVPRFESAFRGLLSYATILQAAIEVFVHDSGRSESVVYRALSDKGVEQPFRAAVGEVIAWPGFIPGVRTIDEAVEISGGPGAVGLIFRIVATADAVAAEIGGFAERDGGSKVLIAAESLFRVDGVGEVRIGEVTVPEVRLSYAGVWSDRDIDLNFPAVGVINNNTSLDRSDPET
jgi:hypothetical protein